MSFPTITDDALASLRALIGRPVRRPEPYIEVANRDAIRHWAHGIGDRNPFWAGGRVAPPTILFAMDRIVSGTSAACQASTRCTAARTSAGAAPSARTTA